MSLLLFSLLIITVLSNTFSTIIYNNKTNNKIKKFEKWIEKYEIEIKNNEHYNHIFNNWIFSDDYINETNIKNLSYKLAHNKYSGLNFSEFSEYMNFNNEIYSKNNKYHELKNLVLVVKNNEIQKLDLPKSIDWRDKQVVSEIRDQKSCGSCWAFSTIATLESGIAIKTGILYDLSEQELVSCAKFKYGNLGCNGGTYKGAFEYIEDNKGICSELSYPYTSQDGNTNKCIKNCVIIPESKVLNYTIIPPNSDFEMMKALVIKPINIVIEADSKSFQLYSSGIYSDYIGCNGNSQNGKNPDSKPNLDHAVVIVGYMYNNNSNENYYILRNSWGIQWGESGYMRIGKGQQYGKYGMCGLLSEPLYPIL